MKINATQLEQVNNQIQKLIKADSFYGKRLKEHGITGVSSVEDFEALPFSEKKDLRGAYPLGLMAEPEENIVRIHSSSGTTGLPVIIPYTAKDVDDWAIMFKRCYETAGITNLDRIQVTPGYGLWTAGIGFQNGAEKLGAMVIPMGPGNTDKQLQMMVDLGSTVLCSTSSYALLLAEEIEARGLRDKIKLRKGVIGSERWGEKMRKRISDELGIELYDIYGLTELSGPGVAYECSAQTGMHINEDHVLAEIIDPVTEEPLPDGVPGELVFTTLTKTGTPMIRYRTHDICTLTHGTCACGRTTVKMSRITGRTDDMLVIRGVNVFPSQIESVLLGVEEASAHYMIVVDRVNSQDKLTVQVELKEDVDMGDAAKLAAIASRIKTDIKQTLLISAKVELVPPKTIPRSEGKAKRITDNRHIGF